MSHFIRKSKSNKKINVTLKYSTDSTLSPARILVFHYPTQPKLRTSQEHEVQERPVCSQPRAPAEQEQPALPAWPGSGTPAKLLVSAWRRVSRCCCSTVLRLRSWITSTSSFSTAVRMLSTCFCSAAFLSSNSMLDLRSCRSSASRAVNMDTKNCSTCGHGW